MAKRGKTRPLAGLAALDRPGQTRKGLDVKPKEGAKVYFYSSTKREGKGDMEGEEQEGGSIDRWMDGRGRREKEGRK